jgi:hypothetical protein
VALAARAGGGGSSRTATSGGINNGGGSGGAATPTMTPQGSTGSVMRAALDSDGAITPSAVAASIYGRTGAAWLLASAVNYYCYSISTGTPPVGGDVTTATANGSAATFNISVQVSVTGAVCGCHDSIWNNMIKLLGLQLPAIRTLVRMAACLSRQAPAPIQLPRRPAIAPCRAGEAPLH